MKLISLADAVRAVQLNTKLSDHEKGLFRVILQYIPTTTITYCKDCTHRKNGKCTALTTHPVTTAEHFHCAYGKER